jgi:hypothetical protein
MRSRDIRVSDAHPAAHAPARCRVMPHMLRDVHRMVALGTASVFIVTRKQRQSD